MMNREIKQAHDYYSTLERQVAEDRARRKQRATRAWHFGLMLALIVGGVALAQDRTITVREVDVLPEHAEVFVQADGGCTLVAYASIVAPSVEPRFSRTQYSFNGTRCTTVKSAIVTAAKKDMQVGDGSLP